MLNLILKSSFVFEILEDIDVQVFYFVESANSMWLNFAILYKASGGYRIYNLATQVRENEEFIIILMEANSNELEEF